MSQGQLIRARVSEQVTNVASYTYRIAPGVALAAIVAGLSAFLAPKLSYSIPIPPIVLALMVGMLFNRFVSNDLYSPGLFWCAKTLLRAAIALLGVRIALNDVLGLGVPVVLAVTASMFLTVTLGIALARAVGLRDEYGALAGAANAVCGASAALATSTVLPSYETKTADIAFAVVAANAISTLVMIAYPPICLAMGLNETGAGVLIGGTIQDMAQVVAAGYSISEPAGNAAVIVKLFRILMLLPIVVTIGWYFARTKDKNLSAKVPMPLFALVFTLFCLLNTVAAHQIIFGVAFDDAKAIISETANWAMLIAIAALGLNTSFLAMCSIGWRHLLVFIGPAAFIFFFIAALLLTKTGIV